MVATLAKDATLERVASHSVSMGVNYRDEIEREECFGYFSATWRGQPVRVTVSADRYRHTSGLSEWRVYAREAREIDPNEQDEYRRNYGFADLSETARRRLGEICVPIMQAWLDSVEYSVSRQTAFVSMLKRVASDLPTYGDRPSDKLTALLLKFAAELPADQAAKLREAGYRFDDYVRALNSVSA